FLLSAAIGVVAGVGGVVFQLASQSVLHVTLESVARYAPQEPAGEHRLFERRILSTDFSDFPRLSVVQNLRSSVQSVDKPCCCMDRKRLPSHDHAPRKPHGWQNRLDSV